MTSVPQNGSSRVGGLKQNCPPWGYGYFRNCTKNIVSDYALKRYVWFSLPHFPIQQYFLHPSQKLLPAIVISSHMEEKQPMYRFKSLKENILSLCVNDSDRKAQKIFARFLKANINFVYCTINATINTLTKRFHRDEKILRLNSSFVCLFFTILKVFENKKDVIKILVYSSVIDINQMDVIFFAIIISMI